MTQPTEPDPAPVPARASARRRLISLPGRSGREPAPARVLRPHRTARTGSEPATRPHGGVPVASFRDYADAEAAVQLLADADQPVDRMTIIGCDLRLVEDVRPRERAPVPPTVARAAGYGAIAGAWLGALVGIVFALVASTSGAGFVAALVWAIALGALFGAPAGLAGFVAVDRTRGFRARQRLQAGRYELYAPAESADEVRSALLRIRPGGVRVVDGGA